MPPGDVGSFTRGVIGWLPGLLRRAR